MYDMKRVCVTMIQISSFIPPILAAVLGDTGRNRKMDMLKDIDTLLFS